MLIHSLRPIQAPLMSGEAIFMRLRLHLQKKSVPSSVTWIQQIIVDTMFMKTTTATLAVWIMVEQPWEPEDKMRLCTSGQVNISLAIYANSM